MRATSGSASRAALRPASFPRDAAAASANSAGLFRGARPACDTATARVTRPVASFRAQSSTTSAFSFVSAFSVA